MTGMQLPAHLQGRASRNLTQKAVAGLGALLPPHISIQGNTFTLIDAAGNEQSVGPTLDCVIVDVSDVNCKKYFDKDWEPGSNEPPTCWSANGVAPSRDAVSPQARRCDECQWNIRGSKISKISGASIKACRDEKWLALLIPSVPGMLFQLVLTPGSFDNWKTYNKKFEGNGIDLDFVTTHLSFVPKINGVIEFNATTFVEPQITALVDKALGEKATDVLVGRNDVPREIGVGQSAAPLPAPTAAPTVLASPPALPSFQQPSAPSFQATPTPPAGTAATASPSNGRKRRNTAPQPEQPQAQPAQAPFRQAAPQPNGPAPAFGMQAGVAPNPELTSAISSVFGDK